jgi:SAM-dependent methyltransferase
VTAERELVELTIPGLHSVVFETVMRLRPPPARVLDLGAGTGAWADRLQRSGFDVTALERTNAYYGASVPLVLADLNDDFAAQLGPARFDIITCIEVVEHIENPRHLLRSARRLTNPGGLVVVTTPNIESTAGRLRFLWTGELRHFGRDPAFNEQTHITPIHSLMFQKALGDVGLHEVEHRYERDMTSGSRWLFGLLALALNPLLRGPRGGDNHIYVLSDRRQS